MPVSHNGFENYSLNQMESTHVYIRQYILLDLTTALNIQLVWEAICSLLTQVIQDFLTSLPSLLRI